MATQTVSPVVQFQQPIPRNFVEALTQGWRLVGEKSKSRGAHRCGTATLERDGRRILVSYFADRDGYRFGSVKVLA